MLLHALLLSRKHSYQTRVAIEHFYKGRPPHGGRGLKHREESFDLTLKVSSPARGTWIKTRFQFYLIHTILNE